LLKQQHPYSQPQRLPQQCHCRSLLLPELHQLLVLLLQQLGLPACSAASADPHYQLLLHPLLLLRLLLQHLQHLLVH
jgi:hypothetical protein